MNFIAHTNYWNWGWSTHIIAEGGIACVTMSFDNDDPGVCFLSGLSVVPKHRRKGYATALMSFCEQMCKKNGIFRIDLRSVKVDFVLDFYHKIGYTSIRESDGVILMYKFIKPMDKVIEKNKQMDELRDLARPLHDWLQKNFHPHATIVIDYDGVKVVEDAMWVPIKTDEK